MLQYNLDDLSELTKIIRKHFPDNKITFEIYNSPEDGNLESVIKVQVPCGSVEDVIAAFDKFDDDIFKNYLDLYYRLDGICVMEQFI